MSHQVAPNLLAPNRLEPKTPASLTRVLGFERFTLENRVVSPYKYIYFRWLVNFATAGRPQCFVSSVSIGACVSGTKPNQAKVPLFSGGKAVAGSRICLPRLSV